MVTTTKPQLFQVGYQISSWDSSGRSLDEAFTFLADAGFRSFEALTGDSLALDAARRFMTVPYGLPPLRRDFEMLARLGQLANAKAAYGLQLAALYAHAEFVNPLTWSFERDVMISLGHFSKGCGASFIILAGGPPAQRFAHTPDAYRLFAARLNEIGSRMRELDVRAVYHPHVDCFVESAEQLDRLMDVLDPTLVGLCLDTAHLHVSGGDPVAVTRRYAEQVEYVHLKDATGEPGSASGADRYQAFCAPGAGQVDLEGFIVVLNESGFAGPLMIEVESNPASAEESCRRGMDFVVNDLGLAIPSPTPSRRTRGSQSELAAVLGGTGAGGER